MHDEILDKLRWSHKSRMDIFIGLQANVRAYTIMRLHRNIQKDILNKLSDNDLVNMLEFLDPDEATHLLRLIGEKRKEKIVQELSDELKKGIEILYDFAPQTAGSLVSLDYIQVETDEEVGEVLKKFQKHEQKRGKSPEIIVVNMGKILGHVPAYKLALAQHSDKIGSYLKDISLIHHGITYDELVKLFKKHNHNKVAVVGDSGNVLGIIYADDILEILREKESASLYDFAGVHNEETVTDRMATKVKFRYKWLIINLATAFLAAFTVGIFDETISKHVLLAVYMPIVAGMGGNAATQTLAVLVRGISLNQVSLKNLYIPLRREVGAGFINGLINGIIVAAIVITVNGDWKLAFVLGIAMIVNLLVAAFFGTTVPLLMKKFNKDPATSATIFITTATDVLGFMAFLGLAAMIL